MKFRRHSSAAFLVIGLLLSLQCLMIVHAADRRTAALPAIQEKQRMVKALQLTDLCLFTEARYTRHPAMADFHSAFQDGPLSFEHFPSGSLVTPTDLMRDYRD